MTRVLPVLLAALALAVPATAGAHVVHDVARGETLSGIAHAAGVPLSALAAANGLSADAQVIAGTTLTVPPAGAAPTGAAAPVPPAPATPLDGYRVRLGDTLSGIAARHGIPLSQLAASNGLDPHGVLLTGTQLRIDGSAGQPAAPAAPTTPSTAAPAAAPGRLTADRVSAIAAEHGVPGSLAAAIGWQESGFNNAMVSTANARGVMQILPSTWDWIRGSLAQAELDPSSAEDNVRAGSLFLSQLLRETGGDPAMAAAGYYQGLASVRRIGMLPDTQRYVANVMALRSRFGG